MLSHIYIYIVKTLLKSEFGYCHGVFFSWIWYTCFLFFLIKWNLQCAYVLQIIGAFLSYTIYVVLFVWRVNGQSTHGHAPKVGKNLETKQFFQGYKYMVYFIAMAANRELERICSNSTPLKLEIQLTGFLTKEPYEIEMK